MKIQKQTNRDWKGVYFILCVTLGAGYGGATARESSIAPNVVCEGCGPGGWALCFMVCCPTVTAVHLPCGSPLTPLTHIHMACRNSQGYICCGCCWPAPDKASEVTQQMLLVPVCGLLICPETC